jgi:leucine dehydrogenase
MFQHRSFADHEHVVHVSDPAVGLRCIIAMHSTRLGPAIGGCRVREYGSEDEALDDVLRLSRGMTMKAAVANVPFGGGKMVVLLDPGQTKTPALMRGVGRAIARLGGHYITGEDVGSTVADMAEIREETDHVLGLPPEAGGSGDPSPSTALGIFAGIEAAVRARLPGRGLSGIVVAVQGLGNVGFNLCHLLHHAGANLVVADVRPELVARAVTAFGATSCEVQSVHAAPSDVFSPCALGAGLNPGTIPEIRARIIAGGANNQLADETRDGGALMERGILYAPDYVINSGGMIQLAAEFLPDGQADVRRRVLGIGDTLSAIFDRSERDAIPTHAAAADLAEARLYSPAGLTAAAQ